MIYIAYKYTNTKDKISLRNNLEELAKIVVSSGCENFILHRDKKNWDKKETSRFASAYHMLRTLPKATQLLAFVDHEEKSLGMWLELMAAKLMGKPITLVVKSGVSAKYIRAVADHVHEFKNTKDLHNLSLSIHQSLNHAMNKAA